MVPSPKLSASTSDAGIPISSAAARLSDEEVDALFGFFNVAERPLDRLLVTKIAFDGVDGEWRGQTRFVGSGQELLVDDVEGVDASSSARELIDDDPADAATASRHYHRPAIQSAHRALL